MKSFAVLAVLAEVCLWVEASTCRASSCNAGIAKAVNCNSRKPEQCVNAIGCQYFYSTTIFRGCVTTTQTVFEPQRTVTRVAQETTTITTSQPVADQTMIVSDHTTNTVLTETSSETTTVATQTQTTVTTVATETSTITEFTLTNTLSETDTETATSSVSVTTGIPPQVGPAFPGNRKRSGVQTKHVFSPAELAEYLVQVEGNSSEHSGIARRGSGSYAIRYPQYVPGAVKSCLNSRSYSAACSCFGARPKTVTEPSSTKTVKVTRSQTAATVSKTNTVTSTVTTLQLPRLVTRTTTIVQLATETTTDRSSVTATSVEIDSTTAEESTTLSTDTATTTTNTITQTITETAATVTQTQNPFPAGGSCGCRQGYTAGQRISDADANANLVFSTSVQPDFASCARACDGVFACNVIDYNILTGVCRQANQLPAATTDDADYYYGVVVFENGCGRGCA